MSIMVMMKQIMMTMTITLTMMTRRDYWEHQNYAGHTCTADASEMFTDVKDDDADASDDSDDYANIFDDADTQKRPPERELLLYSLVGGFHLDCILELTTGTLELLFMGIFDLGQWASFQPLELNGEPKNSGKL